MADEPGAVPENPSLWVSPPALDHLEVLRAFRRRWLLVRRVAQSDPLKGLSFQLHQQGTEGSVRLAGPEQGRMNELAVVMRPLLDRRSEANVWSVWASLRTLLDPEKLADWAPEVEKAFERLENGPVKWRLGNKPFSWSEIYDIVARGDFFSDDEDAAQILKANDSPIARPLLGFQFYAFHDACLRLAALLYSMMDKVDGLRESAVAAQLGPCIFCRGIDGGFTAAEHILPESLIGDDTVLPPGMVCDRCNHGPLSGADEDLANFGLLAVQRVLFLLHTKKGKLPIARLNGLSIEKRAPRRIVIRDHGRRLKVRRDPETGLVDMRLELPVRADWVALGRGLFKSALELVALYEGRDKALEPKFDPARRFVLEGESFNGYLFIEPSGVPGPEARTTWQHTDIGALFHFSIFGVGMAFSLQELRDASVVGRAEALGVIVAPLFADDTSAQAEGRG